MQNEFNYGEGLERKGEIRGLEQAVGFLMSILQHRLFNTPGFEKVWACSKGFRYTALVKEENRRAQLKIFPAGWPTGSYIYASFASQHNANWQPYRCSFYAPHIELLNCTRQVAICEFDISFHPDRFLSFEPVDTADIIFVNALNGFSHF